MSCVCCFCGLDVMDSEAVTIVLYPPVEKEDSQTLYCHRKCLSELVSEKVPLHPGLTEEF